MKVDKPENELSIKNFAQEDYVPDFDEPQRPKEEDFPVNWDEEFNEKLKEYNQNITNLNPKYSKLVPRQKVLVRVFTKELEVTESGIYIPNIERVPIPTQSGFGSIGEVESPYPYATKAVVVAVPAFMQDLKPGMVVQLGEAPTKGVPMGGGSGAAIVIPKNYTHYEYNQAAPPTDPENEHYGYLLVDSRDIEIILEQ